MIVGNEGDPAASVLEPVELVVAEHVLIIRDRADGRGA